MNLSEVTTHRADDATTTLETVESFGIGYSQGAGASTGDWMKPPGDLFLYCDMKDLGADMVSLLLVTLPANPRYPTVYLVCSRRRRRRRH